MISNEAWGVLSLVFCVLGAGSYFWEIWKKGIKPHAFSWIVWTLLAGITFFAQLSEGAGPGAWAMGFATACNFAITLVALRRGEKDITRSDWCAFVAALSAIPLWYFTGNPLGAVVLVSGIDLLGFYPTFRKSYARPREEGVYNFFWSAIKDGLSLAAMENFVLTNTLYPFVMGTSNAVFLAMVLWRRRYKLHLAS